MSMKIQDSSRVTFINLRGQEVLDLAKVRDVVLYYQWDFWRHGKGDLKEKGLVSLRIINTKLPNNYKFPLISVNPACLVPENQKSMSRLSSPYLSMKYCTVQELAASLRSVYVLRPPRLSCDKPLIQHIGCYQSCKIISYPSLKSTK